MKFRLNGRTYQDMWLESGTGGDLDWQLALVDWQAEDFVVKLALVKETGEYSKNPGTFATSLGYVNAFLSKVREHFGAAKLTFKDEVNVKLEEALPKLVEELGGEMVD